VTYAQLDARQKETFNFQKVSAVFAEYGYKTIRLSEDWLGADFLAYPFVGEKALRVQLKSRLGVDSKYWGKSLWICFPAHDTWYVYPHDAAYHYAASRKGAKRDEWLLPTGLPIPGSAYVWPNPPKDWLEWLMPFHLSSKSTSGLADMGRD
jgi:hypothetical protein